MNSFLVILWFFMLTSMLLLVVVQIDVCSANLPADKHKKIVGMEGEGKMFRSKKANLIWSKATQNFRNDENKLNDLHTELKDLDEELMKLKNLKYENMDPLGEIEAHITEKIAGLLHRYTLDRHFGDVKREAAETRAYEMDKKLESLVDKAKNSGFTADELRDLQTEVNHHRRKMAELTVLEEQLRLAEEKLVELPNSIDEQQRKHLGTKQVKDMKMQLKEKKKALHTSVNRLSLLADSPLAVGDITFTQPKVFQLWTEVLKANFTDEERESLRAELMHLEKKMNKKDVLDENMSNLKKKSLNKRPEDEDYHKKAMKEHESIMERTEHLDKTVRKHAKDIQHKISKRLQHNEL